MRAGRKEERDKIERRGGGSKKAGEHRLATKQQGRRWMVDAIKASKKTELFDNTYNED